MIEITKTACHSNVHCANRPGDDEVADILEKKFDHTSKDITFAQWITTDRTERICQALPVNEYLKSLMPKQIKLLPQSFIAKQRFSFLKECKQIWKD